jgi:hypothetical protein
MRRLSVVGGDVRRSSRFLKMLYFQEMAGVEEDELDWDRKV